VPIVFYRALVQSGNTAPVDALVRALATRRLRPLPIFVQSLKDAEAASLLTSIFAAHPPAVILNATGFSVAASGGDDPLRADCPVLQIVFSGGDEESWRAGTRGLGPRDLAMNVALPEIDGRILSRAVSFKAPLGRDPETEADLVGYRPRCRPDRFCRRSRAQLGSLAREAAGRAPHRDRARQLPNRDGRIGNGVGLDTPQSAITLLHALRDAGYRVGDIPEDGTALIRHLLAGPTNARPQAPYEESLPFNEYSAFFASQQQPVQQHVAAQWGSAERDPFFHPSRLTCGDFAIPGFRTGNIALLVQPARGYNLDPKATYHDPALPPPHSYFATYAWLADSFRADAVVDLGKHGTLEWLPGKALALSAECFPEAVWAAAASLPVHRQRPWRGDAGEAPCAGRHHRPSDPVHARRQLWRASRIGAADRRILRRAARRSATGRAACRRHPGARPHRWHRFRLRHHRRRESGGSAEEA
jgi:cobaltochelatase CobN